MGSVIPKNLQEKIVFCENHNATWNTNATAIGTTTAAITDLTTKTTAARAAFNAQQLALDNAKSATLAVNNAVQVMADAAADVIKSIKAKAATAGSGVYTLANIPAPATPTPVGPPGTPSNFTIELIQGGALRLTWKCANPAGSVGTIYQVYRKVGTATAYDFLTSTGTRRFTDETIPAGSSAVTYKIVAVRSTASGDPAEFTVGFGLSGGGELTASVVATPDAPRMAA